MLMKNSGSIHQACAACKHQRRKCKIDCELAPFFPAGTDEQFKKVHMVFGVSNIIKLLKSMFLDTHEKRARAMESLCWEADWRMRDPIEGCWGEYKRQGEELQRVKIQLQEMVKVGFSVKNSHSNNTGTTTTTTTNTNNNNNVYCNGNGDLLMENMICGPYVHGFEGGGGQVGKDHLGGVVCAPPPSMNGLTHHYYLQDQLNRLRAKAISDAIWRDDQKAFVGFDNL